MNQTMKLSYEEFINVACAVMEATKQKEGKKIDEKSSYVKLKRKHNNLLEFDIYLTGN